MLRKLLAASAMIAFCTHGAAAQFVDWRNGTAVVTAASAGCTANGTNVGDAYNARYRHPNLGDNSNQARLSIFSRRTAHNFIRDVDFTNAFQVASSAAFIGSGTVTHNTPAPSGPYLPEIRMTKRTPATITEATPQIYMTFKIKKFFVNPGVTNCNIDLTVTVLRNE